ncbi:MAG: STAS domain-containing protein [Planctomycetota bacterium]
MTLTERGDVEIMAVTGAIHSEDNDSFADALEDIRERERFRVVMDGRGLEYLNSRAVGALVAFSRDARICGGRVVIVSPNRTVNKILKAVGLLSLVPSYDTLEEAVAACCGGRDGA